jgi:predicted transcriptional regulator
MFISSMTITAGGESDDGGVAFPRAWHRAERGEAVAKRVLAFESWEGLARVLTGERFRLFRHVHGIPPAKAASQLGLI